MKRFSFKMLAVASAVCAFCWLGCGGGDDNNPADNSGNNNSNNNSNNNGGQSGSLVCASGEAWLRSGSGKPFAIIFKQNGTWLSVKQSDDGKWVPEATGTYSISGDKVTTAYQDGKKETEIVTYSISGNMLTITDSKGKVSTYTKTSGVAVDG